MIGYEAEPTARTMIAPTIVISQKTRRLSTDKNRSDL